MQSILWKEIIMKNLLNFFIVAALTICTSALSAKPSPNLKAWAMESQIDLKQCDPIIIRSSDKIKSYIFELAELLRTKRYGDPVVAYYGDEDNAGYSVMQFIEKACILVQCANKTNNAYINIICSKPYDPRMIAQFTQRYFNTKNSTLNVTVRA